MFTATSYETQHSLEDIPTIMLCGGVASRLSSVTQSQVPKHLLPAGGRTILDYAVEPFLPAGKIILATGNHAAQIEHYARNKFGEQKVDFSRETHPLGVIGALSQAIIRHQITDQFIIAHGDEITENFDLADMFESHQSSGAELTALTTTVTPKVKDFSFQIGDNQRAVGLKRSAEIADDPNASNYGIGTFVCKPTILDTMASSPNWTEFLLRMIDKRSLQAYSSSVIFHNINLPDDLEDFIGHVTDESAASA